MSTHSTVEPSINANVAELIAAIGNPAEEDIWGCGPITETDVLSCPDPSIGRLPAGMTAEDTQSREYNIARIAWLIENHDHHAPDHEPIEIAALDLLGSWPILDGNHRLAAAHIAGIKTIPVELHGDIWW